MSIIGTTDDYRTVSLDRMLFKNRVAFSKEVLAQSDARMMMDNQMDRAIVELSVQVLSNPSGRIDYSFPATPWDHWKREWLPRLGPLGKWYLKRHPVRLSHDVKSAIALYPEATIAYPEGLGPVKFLIQ